MIYINDEIECYFILYDCLVQIRTLLYLDLFHCKSWSNGVCTVCKLLQIRCRYFAHCLLCLTNQTMRLVIVICHYSWVSIIFILWQFRNLYSIIQSRSFTMPVWFSLDLESLNSKYLIHAMHDTQYKFSQPLSSRMWFILFRGTILLSTLTPLHCSAISIIHLFTYLS